MSQKATARRIAERSCKLKDKLISMHYEAENAGLNDLAEELVSAFIQMDEVIGEAEDAAKHP